MLIKSEGATKALSTTVVLLGALFVWRYSTTVMGWIPESRFPQPHEVWAALQFILHEGYGNGTLLNHVLHSLQLVAMGFSVATFVGVLLGLLMGFSKKVEAFLNPAFLVLRPIPPLAWIPLAIVWLGLGDGAKVMVIFVAAFVPALINTFTGVRQIEQPIREAASMLGTRGFRLFWHVLIMGGLPMIFTGLRLSLQASWTTLVAAELIGAAFGLGSILNQAAQDIYPAMILLAMMMVGLAGGFTSWLLAQIERRALAWHPSMGVK